MTSRQFRSAIGAVSILALSWFGEARAQTCPGEQPRLEYKMNDVGGTVQNTGSVTAGSFVNNNAAYRNGASLSGGYVLLENGRLNTPPGNTDTRCNGTTRLCEHLFAGDPALASRLGTANTTIMAWVRWDVPPTDGPLGAVIATFSNGAATSGGNGNVGQIWLRHNSTNTGFEFVISVQEGGSSVALAVTSNVAIQQGVWYHVAGLYVKDTKYDSEDPLNSGRGLYIFVFGQNVAKAGQGTDSSIVAAHDDDRWAIGAQPNIVGGVENQATNGFTGAIEDVRLFYDALTPTSIRCWMGLQSSPPTPVTIEDIQIVNRGVDVDVSALLGPTSLELWRDDGRGAPQFTGASVLVDGPGRFPLRDTSPSANATPFADPSYVVVDRGVAGIAGVYDGSGLPAPDAARGRGFVVVEPSLQRHGPPESAQHAAWLRSGGTSSNDAPQMIVAGDEGLAIVELPGDGTEDGIVAVPAVVNGRAVVAGWLDGVRRPAFECGAGRSCILAPPQDVHEDRAYRRSLTLETAAHGRARRVVPAANANGAAARLVVERAVDQPFYFLGWMTPLQRMMHIGYIWPGFIDAVPLHTARLNGEGDLRRVDLSLRSWDDSADRVHRVVVSNGTTSSNEMAYAGVGDDVSTSIVAGSGIEDLSVRVVGDSLGFLDTVLVSRATLERDRLPSLVDGSLAARVAEGGRLAFGTTSGAVLLMTDRSDGSGADARLVAVGRGTRVDSGLLVAAAPASAVAARPLRGPVLVPSPANAIGADLVVVHGASPVHDEEIRWALRPWLDARAGKYVRAEVVSLASLRAAYGTSNDQAALNGFVRALSAGASDGRLVRVVLAGSPTAEPDVDLDGDTGVYVPTFLSPTRGWSAASDAAIATASDGTWLPNVVMARWPIRSVEALAAVAVAYASDAAAETDGLQDELLVSDPTADFRGSLNLFTATSIGAGIDLDVVDGFVAGSGAARTAFMDALGTGTDLVWYVGHGSHDGLGGFLWTGDIDDVTRLTQGPGTTFIGLTCFTGSATAPRTPELFVNGLFDGPDFPVRSAVIGSGVLDMMSHERFGHRLAQAMLGDADTLSEAWLAARDAAFVDGADRGILDSFVLLGDPYTSTGVAR